MYIDLIIISLISISVVFGWRRPGFLIGLIMLAYSIEQHFGGNQMVGYALNLAVMPLAALLLVFRYPRFKVSIIDWVVVGLGLVFLYAFLVSAITTGGAIRDLLDFSVRCVLNYFAIRIIMSAPYRPATVACDFALVCVVGAALLSALAQESGWGFRTSVGDSTPVGFSIVFLVSLCGAIGLLFSSFAGRWALASKLLLLSAIAVLLDGLLANGTRGAIIGVFVAFLVSGLAALTVRLAPATRIIAVFAAVTSGALVVAMAPTLHSQITSVDRGAEVERALAPLEIATGMLAGRGPVLRDGGGAIGGSIGARLALYESAVSNISDKPIIGHGLGSSRELLGVYPHNLFLQAWLELGLPGLLLFCAAIISGIAIGLSAVLASRAAPEAMVPLCVFLGYAVQSQFSLSLSMAVPMFVSLAMLVSLKQRHGYWYLRRCGVRFGGSTIRASSRRFCL